MVVLAPEGIEFHKLQNEDMVFLIYIFGSTNKNTNIFYFVSPVAFFQRINYSNTKHRCLLLQMIKFDGLGHAVLVFQVNQTHGEMPGADLKAIDPSSYAI